MTNRQLKMNKAALFLMAAAFLIGTASVRADLRWEHKLTDPNGVAGDSFGSSVSISGDLCIVGAPVDDDNGTDAGSAYIFRFDGFDWTPEAKLTASDGSAGDMFGISVSIDGAICLIGAYGDSINGNYTGSAYIFRYDDPNWVEEAKLVAFDGDQNDEFGASVSISSNACVIGTSGDDDNGDGSGSAYVFRFNGNDWLYEEKFLASDGQAGDLFGTSVSMSADLCIIGAKFDSDNGDKSGSAYIFRYDDPNWVPEAKLLPSDGAAGDFFGGSVSLDGNLCIIGANGDDDIGERAGSAYIFRFSDPNWVQEVKLTASDGNAWDSFGRSVSISNDVCVVGAHLDSDNASQSGSAYIFGFNGSIWDEVIKLVAFDAAEQDHFGWSVSVDSDNAIVGAIRQNDYTGAAYSFQPCPEADLTGDCFVNVEDFAVLVGEWFTGEDL